MNHRATSRIQAYPALAASRLALSVMNPYFWYPYQHHPTFRFEKNTHCGIEECDFFPTRRRGPAAVVDEDTIPPGIVAVYEGAKYTLIRIHPSE